MSVYKDGSRWRYRSTITLPDGSRTRISGTCTPNTKASCEAAERVRVERVLKLGPQVGRPSATDEPRAINLTVRVSATELEQWHSYAAAHGFESVSDAVRAAMNHLVGRG